MYAHPSFIRNDPEALIELRKVSSSSSSSGPASPPSLLQRRMILADSDIEAAVHEEVNLGKTIISTMKSNIQHQQENATRSVSPSLSSSDYSTGSSCSSPVGIPGESKFYVPSRESFGKCCTSISTHPSLVESEVHNALYRNRQAVPNIVPPCPIPILSLKNCEASGKNVKSSGSDRGKLDLLALALEYECFRSSGYKRENSLFGKPF
jgi:hypothetical protein